MQNFDKNKCDLGVHQCEIEKKLKKSSLSRVRKLFGGTLTL